MESKITISNEELQNKLIELYTKKKLIHITINSGRLKVNNVESYITGIYKYFVCIESKVNNYHESFSIKTVDIKIGKVVISELDIK